MQATTEKETPKSHVFSFGDAEPVLSSNPMEYLGTFLDIGGEYYRPPVSLDGLANLMDANPHHGTIVHFKKNMIMKWMVTSTIAPFSVLQPSALDFTFSGNMYFQRFKNRFGKTLRLARQPARVMRRGKKPGQFFRLNPDGSTTEFKKDEIIHIMEPGVKQEIYGEPEYLGGIQSVLLSEDAGLFRRKYYLNGAHMGYILLTNDIGLDEKDAKAIEAKVKNSKGPGNFRSMMINIGKTSAKEPVQIIPVGDISTKDEFERVKNITMKEILSMHRMQPGLCGVIPENVGGFADLEKTMKVYHELEIEAMQQPFLEINEQLGSEVISFKKPVWRDDEK